MTQEDLLHRIVGKLVQAGIPHMLTGSHASSAYGKGRATEDIDIIIDATAAQLA